tara:strand:+ start:815 stop:1978 length:1164 start_codon:yes stop_codon:yes gene_type:complete
MKKKIGILGSTGSIGKTTFSIIKKNRKDFDIIFLTTNKNVNAILKQAKELNVKNIIIFSKEHYFKTLKNKKNKNVKIFNNLKDLKKIINNRLDYLMCAITGLSGLKPTIDCIKLTKKIAIANKESIICAWNLIEKELLRYKTEFVPVDSEHFSIWSLIKNSKNHKIDKILITASGGPFLNLPINRFENIKPKDALKHPSWSMGKKISIDSATMINKVFEIIEAKRMFKMDLKKFEILIHPKSYLHAIVKFENGLTKMLIHDTNMTIPIFNSIYSNKSKKIYSKKINLNYLNNLKLSKPDKIKFPMLKILKKIPSKISLFETVLVTANDELVEYFLNGQISYLEIQQNLFKIINFKEFKKYFYKKPQNIDQITKVIKEARLKTRNLCV